MKWMALRSSRCPLCRLGMCVTVQCRSLVDPSEPSHECGYRPCDGARNWKREVAQCKRDGKPAGLLCHRHCRRHWNRMQMRMRSKGGSAAVHHLLTWFTSMSSSFGRFARLTLFSGPNCSLCDVRCFSSVGQDSRPMTNYISTDREGGTCKSQTDTAVPVGDDKHPKQGAREVEEEIRVLDSSPARRREGGREGSMGRDTRQPSPRPVGEGAPEDEWRGLDDSWLFFVDTREAISYWDHWIYPGAISYHRLDERLLGEPERPEGDNRLGTGSTPGPRCFNCGSTEHLLSSCPDPRNRALIDLSRQFFAFFADDTSHTWKRIHEVGEWRSRRLEWTRVYRPGEIAGSLLRDALGPRDADGTPNMPWLENISLWGYPPGWISHEDPVERVRRRILDEADTSDDREPSDSCLFAVLDDTDSEILQLDDLFSSSSSDPASDARVPRRWAVYPNTYFLSDILPAYAGRVQSPLAEVPRFDGRHQPSQPPSGVQPPPPTDSPPPLPPSFPHDDSFDEVDMDLSD